MEKQIKSLIKVIIGVLIIFVLLQKIGFSSFFNVLKTIELSWFFVSLFLGLLTFVIIALNHLILLSALDKKINFKTLLQYITFSWSLSSMFPGRVGDLGLLVLLKNNHEVGYGEGLAITFIDKIITLIVLLLFSAFGLIIFFGLDIFLLLSFFFILGLLLLYLVILKEGIRNFIKKRILKSYSQYFFGFSKSMKTIIFRKKIMFLNLFLTISLWMFSFFLVHLVFLAFNVKFSFFMITVIFSLVNLISLVPITISGLGVREGTGTYLLNQLGVSTAVGFNIILTRTFQRYIYVIFFYIINQNLLKKNNWKISKKES